MDSSDALEAGFRTLSLLQAWAGSPDTAEPAVSLPMRTVILVIYVWMSYDKH